MIYQTHLFFLLKNITTREDKYQLLVFKPKHMQKYVFIREIILLLQFFLSENELLPFGNSQIFWTSHQLTGSFLPGPETGILLRHWEIRGVLESFY